MASMTSISSVLICTTRMWVAMPRNSTTGSSTSAAVVAPAPPVDLPLIVLPGLAEHGQEHDHPLSSTPVRDPGRNVTQADPQFPDRSFQVIGPRAAEFGAFLGEHAAYLIDPLEVDVAEAVQPVTDFGLELEVIQAPYPAAHAWPGYRVCSRTQPDRDRILPGRRASGPSGISSLAAGTSCRTPSARHGMYPEPRRAGHRRPREHLAHPETCRCADPRSAAASGPLVIRTLALLTRTRGAKLGANDHRHTATPGHV